MSGSGTAQLDRLDSEAQTRLMLQVRSAFRNLGRGVF